MAFAGVSATTNHLACLHVAVEIGGCQIPNAFFDTIELLRRLGGINKCRGPVALHPLPVDQRGNGHQIAFSVSGSSIDIHRLQWVQLILGIESHPFSIERRRAEIREYGRSQTNRRDISIPVSSRSDIIIVSPKVYEENGISLGLP